jgi:hypothetical protein
MLCSAQLGLRVYPGHWPLQIEMVLRHKPSFLGLSRSFSLRCFEAERYLAFIGGIGRLIIDRNSAPAAAQLTLARRRRGIGRAAGRDHFFMTKNRPVLPGGSRFQIRFLFAVAEAARPPSRASGLGVARCSLIALRSRLRGGRRRRGPASAGLCRVGLGLRQEAHLFAHG